MAHITDDNNPSEQGDAFDDDLNNPLYDSDYFDDIVDEPSSKQSTKFITTDSNAESDMSLESLDDDSAYEDSGFNDPFSKMDDAETSDEDITSDVEPSQDMASTTDDTPLPSELLDDAEDQDTELDESGFDDPFSDAVDETASSPIKDSDDLHEGALTAANVNTHPQIKAPVAQVVNDEAATTGFDDPFNTSSTPTDDKVYEAKDDIVSDIEEDSPVPSQQDNIAVVTSMPLSTLDPAPPTPAPTPAINLENLPLVQATARQYDTATFRLLDPDDANPQLRSFVQCTTCNALYTTVSWERHRTCVRCGMSTSTPVRVASPGELSAAQKTKAILDVSQDVDLKTVGVVTSIEKPEMGAIFSGLRTYFVNIGINVGLLIRNLLVAAVLISLATFIAANAFRIDQLDEITPSIVLDTMLRSEESLPDRVLLAALNTTVLVAFALYPIALRGHYQNVSFIRRLIRIAASVILIGFSAVLLQEWRVIPPEDFIETIQDIIDFKEWRDDPLIITQLAAVVVTVITVPIYRLLGKRMPVNIVSGRLFKFLAGMRYLLVSVSALIAASAFSIYYLFPKINNPDLLVFDTFDNTIAITHPAVAAFLATSVIGVILYHRPQYNGDEKPLWFLRFIVLVVAVGGLGLLYTTTPNVEGLLEAMPYAAGMAVLLLPVQRALS